MERYARSEVRILDTGLQLVLMHDDARLIVTHLRCARLRCRFNSFDVDLAHILIDLVLSRAQLFVAKASLLLLLH